MSNGLPSSSSSSQVEEPWRQSKNGSTYCLLANLPDKLKSQLKEEHGFQVRVGGYHYYVLKTDDGNFLVFRNQNSESEGRQRQYFEKRSQNSLMELTVLPLEEANELLRSSVDYVVLGDDPVKIVNGQFFAVLGKKKH